MTFDDILAQIIDLLQRQGRVSYGALKRRFDLNDDYLNDLKDELLFAHPVVDEDNRGLVWTGATASVKEVVAQAAQPTQSLAAQQQPSLQVTPLPTVPPAPAAERRQLTVMFCDLVDSTSLAGRLDPEDYREVVRAYQATCTEVIRRYDGYIAQLLGDGLLVYFGYPQAHEDDAQRAVRTALGILDEMENLQTRLQQDKGIQLALRVGIHTGLVVVGAMGSGDRQEQLALGETPNIAARIQGLAAPNTIAISEVTYHLAQGYFDCEAFGVQTLRGVAEPLNVYSVLQESGARGRLEVAVTRGLTPLVGREQEVGLLLERWNQVKAGHGQVVLLTGDAGIGKSRLVQMLKEHVVNEPHTRWECRSAEYAQNTALFPLTDLFQRLLRFHAEDTLDEKCSKLEQMLNQYRLPLEESVPLFAPLLALPVPENHYPPLNLSPQHTRQRTLEAIVAILQEHAEQQPVLFILEDLHWTDPTTLEWLHLLIDQTPTAAMLVLLTCRPHFQPTWSHRSYLSEVTVSRLSHTEVEQIVTGMTEGTAFPVEVLQHILTKTDGVPLFVEELTKAILESGQLTAVDGHYALTGSFSTCAIPATLQDSLMARLDRLVTAKGIAQIGATIGRQFAYGLLQSVSQVDDLTLQRELGRLVAAELLYQRGLPPQATYTFKHALIQDAAYALLLKSTRLQYHQRIAQVLEAQFPETAEAQPELLAHHYTEAGDQEHAVGYWQRAGERAFQRSAHLEAVQHFTTGLQGLATLPHTLGRDHQELDVQIALGLALVSTKGQAAREVEQAYARAQELCVHLGATPQLFQTLQGLWRSYNGRGALLTGRQIAEQLLRLAQRAAVPALLLEAHGTFGNTLFYLGDYADALTQQQQGTAFASPTMQRSHGLHNGVATAAGSLAVTALTLWCLGYPTQAVQKSQEALALARTLAHPYSMTIVQHWAASLHHRRREPLAVQAQIDILLPLATAQGFSLYAGYGTCWQGWVLAMQGEGARGIAQLQQGMAAVTATGQTLTRPLCLLLLAEAGGQVGQVDEGLRLLANALTALEASGRGDLRAEAYRLQGEFLLRQDRPDVLQAETCFHHAIHIAQSQQAKSWELRAATSLARLWQQQGKRDEARQVLAEVYNWFTEGFDTADLQDAKASLDALA